MLHNLFFFVLLTCALLGAEGRNVELQTTVQDDGLVAANKLIASYSALPDPFHWISFYSLPRTTAAAEGDAWSQVNATAAVAGVPPGGVSYWCRSGDYSVCLLFDEAGVVAGLQVSVSVNDFEQSFGSSQYPIGMESQWRRQSLLGTEVYSATALFVPVRVLSEGGRTNFSDQDDTVLEDLYLENGNSFWRMPANARDAAEVAYTMQGCVKGMGHHFFYNMSPKMACDEHRPFFLLFDDVTGDLHGFGVTLFGKVSRSWWNVFSRRWWLEAPGQKQVAAMAPQAPQCFLDWTQQKGLVALHVYFRPRPWEVTCSQD